MKLTRQAWTALRAMIVLTIVLGILYPAVIWVVGLAMPSQSNGSLLRDSSGAVVGSSLIGQSYTDKEGRPLPQWFQSRPSAAGTGYDASASSGSNYGPENKELIAAIRARQAGIAKLDGVSTARIPADAVTASASGLDPDISEAYALLQVGRVAAARQLDTPTVRALVEKHVAGRELGDLGEPVVNVVELNLALSQLH
ncbi:potassium-transporting ATPase subunit KdpC [Pseudolysinimonas kribbensis]|uniref:Potassium-transporting ATPase KdpC subunit n=1 Tax=Pseudolysinimonas kribbensis TaxID=433641 RepID=A0ABQ6K806_9MICO|nr:potassium-transporting ATPase subunit KdpC [Pseudolysinimonas kribbensis]GMA96806.1 potassium-transporting ATPase KdpC subunit [Pseudolysinimonas kribbensis]